MITDAENYYKLLNGGKVICVDFDNTVCLDEWPYIGPLIEDAIKVLKELIRNGHMLILYTQRSANYPICCEELKEYSIKEYGMDLGSVDILTPAMKILIENGVSLWSINQNALWENTTNDYSRKVFADYFIDDHNVGMKYKIITNKFGENCKVCDWQFIDEWFVSEGLYNKKVL